MIKIVIPLVIILMLASTVGGTCYSKATSGKIDCSDIEAYASNLSFCATSPRSSIVVKRDSCQPLKLSLDFGKVQPNSIYCYKQCLKITNNDKHSFIFTVDNDDRDNRSQDEQYNNISAMLRQGAILNIQIDNYNNHCQYIWTNSGFKTRISGNSSSGITLMGNTNTCQNCVYVSFTLETPYSWKSGDHATLTILFNLKALEGNH